MAKLSSLTIGEVSFCKKGMNQHARVALFKSADTSPQALAKATFQEALEGNMIAGAVNEAFYQSFDGLWERNDAFRAALADEFAEGGDGTQASAAYVASVKTLVDEAVGNARAAGATAADTASIDKAFTDAADAWLLTKSKPEENIMKFANKAALLASVAKFNPAVTTVAEVAEIQKAAEEFGCEADLPVALAKSVAPDAALIRKVAILEMPADVRKHFDALDQSVQDAFLAKSEQERAADVEKANATDPVLHKCLDGTEIRKSDGAAALALAKRGDAQETELAKLRGTVTTTTLEKRAAAYPNVAQNVAVAMLKSADTVGGADSEAGKLVLKDLDTMNAAQGRLHKTLGTTEPGTSLEGGLAKARSDFDSRVGEIAKRDDIDRASAMSKARTEHADLFAEAYPASVATEAAA